MTWQQLLTEGKVKVHLTSAQELHDLRSVVERDLEDAEIDQLSADRRFATAYNAVLQLAKIILACEGYRVSGIGHHQTTFQAVQLALGPQVYTLARYFDRCRRKRNTVDYDMAGAASETEVAELLKRAEEFRLMTETWIGHQHPQYALPTPPSP